MNAEELSRKVLEDEHLIKVNSMVVGKLSLEEVLVFAAEMIFTDIRLSIFKSVCSDMSIEKDENGEEIVVCRVRPSDKNFEMVKEVAENGGVEEIEDPTKDAGIIS